MTEAIQVKQVEIPLAGRAKELALAASQFKVTTKESAGGAGDLTRQIKSAWEQIEEQRDSYVRPLFEAERGYNEQFKPLQAELKNAESLLKNLIKTWQNAEKRRADEERAAQAAEQRKAEAEAKEAGREPPAPPPPPPESKTVRGEYGSKATVKEKWVHEVTDLAAVPLRYLQVDDAMVKAALAEGVREIPGIRIWDEGQVSVG